MSVSKSDVENIWGEVNIRIWSNLDNDTSEADTDRITLAITYARNVVNARFEYSAYSTPLVESGLVATWIAQLAGIWLYQVRGMRDEDVDNKVAAVSDQVNREIDWTLAGMRTLSSQVRSTSGPSAPVSS